MKRLDTIANVAVIVTCTLASVLVGIRIWNTVNPPPAKARAQEVPYKQGDVMDALPGVDYAAARKTLLLYASTRCAYCTASAPFYRDLSKLRAQGDLRLVAVGIEPAETLLSYLKAQGVVVDDVVRLPEGVPPRVRVTPTLVLVTQSGKVEKSWVGLLPPGEETDVKSAWLN